jgi:hypothetical protein
MSKSRILIQLDSDPQPSVFDAVVAVDSGVEQLLRHAAVQPAQVRDLVYGAIFTRGPADLRATALFIGGSQVPAAEALLAEVQKTFFGPLRVSVLFDPYGANTTAAAAVLAASRHVPLANARALVLAATGPVGSRVVRLLAAAGSQVRVASRDAARANQVCRDVRHRVPAAQLEPCQVARPDEAAAALADCQLVVAAGAPGIELLSGSAREQCRTLRAAIDLSAVPPLGLAGVESTDSGTDRGGAACYGALGVGRTKMKIHKAALRQLFEAQDQVLDAEEILALGQRLPADG